MFLLQKCMCFRITLNLMSTALSPDFYFVEPSVECRSCSLFIYSFDDVVLGRSVLVGGKYRSMRAFKAPGHWL